MERKIGEIFEFGGEWYQCVEQPEKYDKTVCALCAFQGNGNCELDMCSGTYRSDKKSVIFKKLEKVGGPHACRNMSFGRHAVILQRYKLFTEPILTDDSILNVYDTKNKTILIALNNKEDMKEEKHSNFENIGKNLKPFDLEAAKAGKPVCTRDGRKARIICFDRVTNSTNEYTGHLIVLVTNPNGDEQSFYYTEKGNLAGGSEYDNHKWGLMMLPEKKEGWINVCKNLNTGRYELDDEEIYDTKEEALQNLSSMTYVATVKIEWEK